MSLQVDEFILIPARHMVKCTDTKIQKSLKLIGPDYNWDDRGLHILTQPDDTQQAVIYRGYSGIGNNWYLPSGLVTMEPIDWTLPPEGGAVVIAATRADGVHVKEDTVDLRLEYHARHFTL